MIEQRYGRILNMASIGVFGLGRNGPYAAAKGGLLALTLDAAEEGRDQGILVNALMPGAHTWMTDHRDDEYFRANFGPERVAPTAAFLVSDELSAGGMFFHSAGGLTARIAYTRFPGYYDADRSPENVRDHFAELANAQRAGDGESRARSSISSSRRRSNGERRGRRRPSHPVQVNHEPRDTT